MADDPMKDQRRSNSACGRLRGARADGDVWRTRHGSRPAAPIPRLSAPVRRRDPVPQRLRARAFALTIAILLAIAGRIGRRRSRDRSPPCSAPTRSVTRLSRRASRPRSAADRRRVVPGARVSQRRRPGACLRPARVPARRCHRPDEYRPADEAPGAGDAARAHRPRAEAGGRHAGFERADRGAPEAAGRPRGRSRASCGSAWTFRRAAAAATRRESAQRRVSRGRVSDCDRLPKGGAVDRRELFRRIACGTASPNVSPRWTARARSRSSCR